MKRIIFTLALFVGFVLSAQCQTINSLLDYVRQVESVERLKIPRFMMALGKNIGGVADMPLVRGINGMEIFDMEDCSQQDKQKCIGKIAELQDGEEYETLIKAKDCEDDVRIMMKQKGNYIREIVIVNIEKDSPSIVRYWGKMKKDDLNELISKDDK